MKVDSSEVRVNVIGPNVLLFRITDYIGKMDGKKAYFHGYQILYTGDYRAAIGGLLKCEITSDTVVTIYVPCVTSSLLHCFETWTDEMTKMGHPVYCVQGAYTSALSKFLANQKLQYVAYAIDFGETGETLDNSIFSSGKGDEVLPRAVRVDTKQIIPSDRTTEETHQKSPEERHFCRYLSDPFSNGIHTKVEIRL